MGRDRQPGVVSYIAIFPAISWIEALASPGEIVQFLLHAGTSLGVCVSDFTVTLDEQGTRSFLGRLT